MADSVSITPGSGDSIAADEIAGVKHQRVKITIGADGTNDGDVSSANPIPITGDITRVRNVVDGTISTLGTLTRVDRVMNVIDGTLTTLTGITNALPSGTNDLGNVIRVKNVVDGTLTTITGVDRVRNLVDGTITTVGAVTNITNSISVYLSATAGTIGVDVGKISGRMDVGRVHNLIDGTIRVGNITGSTLQVNVGTIAGTTAVYLHSTSGTVVVKVARESAGVGIDDSVFTQGTGTGVPIMGLFDDSSPDSVDENDVGVLRMTGNRLLMNNIQATAGIFTISGSTSGGTTSGVTLVAPSASYNFKVFAYSLQTTGIVSEAWRFTNGAGTETELWRPLITAVETSSTPKGANLAVSPPGYIFATGVNTTLALKSSTGSLVHYSVSYIKESA